MFTTHTFTVDTTHNDIVSINHHPFVDGKVSVFLHDGTMSTQVRLAAMVDTSQPEVTTDFFVNHTGRPIGDDLLQTHKFDMVGYVTFKSGASIYGASGYKMVPKNNKKYELKITLTSATVSQQTMSLLLTQILKTKLALDDAYVSNHISTGILVNNSDGTSITASTSEDFFLNYYGSFVGQVSALPTFAGISFTKVV